MIRDTTAQRIASDWHGGQWTALYALSSSGAIVDGVMHEINEVLCDNARPMTNTEWNELQRLYAYAQTNGPRDAQPNWYQNVICKEG